jgi:hypothetical protein
MPGVVTGTTLLAGIFAISFHSSSAAFFGTPIAVAVLMKLSLRLP